MRIWWAFRCDQGHAWEAFVADSPEPPAELVKCPVDQTAAVTASRQVPADRVRVEIVPAARVSDRVTGAISHDLEYYLEICPVDRSDCRRSAKPGTWDEVVRKAGLFRGVSWPDALRRWNRAGLDQISGP